MKVQNKLKLQCFECNSIMETPEYAMCNDNFNCPNCEITLAYCDKLYHTFRKTPIIWVVKEWEVEDGNCNLQIIKAKII